MGSMQPSPLQQQQPRLSPSQKAYREDPDGFVARLHARARSLFQDGYTVRPGSASHEFVVARAGAGDATVTEYTVHAWEERCSCPFHARQAAGETLTTDGSVLPCKHLLGLPALVRETWRRQAREGEVQAVTGLWRHWMVFVAARRRQRREAEWTQRRHSSSNERKEERHETC